MFLPDPRGASLHEAFQFSSVRPSVRLYIRTSPFGLVLSYTANLPRTHNIFTDSEPPIKLLIGVLIRGAHNPPSAPYGRAKVFFGGYD